MVLNNRKKRIPKITLSQSKDVEYINIYIYVLYISLYMYGVENKIMGVLL